jgi:hypothetical protein
MATLSKKEAEQQQKPQAKDCYWQNELDPLGIETKRQNQMIKKNLKI